jgi:hypothetical protein
MSLRYMEKLHFILWLDICFINYGKALPSKRD